MSLSIWEKYEKSKEYLETNSIITKTQRSWNFYVGKQWEGLESGGEELPFFNIIKSAVQYKVNTVAQNVMTANYSDDKGRADFKDTYKMFNDNFAAEWKKGKMDKKSRALLKESAISGDAYTFFGTGDIKDGENIPNTQVLLADEQEPDIQSQPYIMIRERLFVRDVKAIGEANGIEEAQYITSDDDNDYQVGNKKDVDNSGDDGKITSVIYMEKKDGIVHVARAVRGCVYEELHPMQVTDFNGKLYDAMTLYPIVSMVWEDIPNSARGESAVAEMIPNQIEINKTLAKRSTAISMYAYPRMAYDASRIVNSDDLDKVGAAIALNNGDSQGIQNLITYLNPASMSTDAKEYTDDVMSTTKSLEGSSDAMTGAQNDLSRVSGSAVIAIRDQAALSLNDNVAKYKQYVEDIARLSFELLKVYHPNGIEIQTENGPEKINSETLAELTPDVKIDVTQDTAYSRQSEQEWWDEQLQAGRITLKEYADNIPSGGKVNKPVVQKMLESRPQLEQLESEIQAIQASEMQQQNNSPYQQGDNQYTTGQTQVAQAQQPTAPESEG